MSTTATNKLALPLAPLLPRLELDAPGQALLEGAADVPRAIALLIEGDRLHDALRLIAHALPKREAVWWACMCARLRTEPTAQASLDAAETWVRKPDETTRRAAMAAAEAGAFRHAEDWAAVAAFWSGGSISPEGQPAVEPADNLTGVAVASAIILAAMRQSPERAPARMQQFLGSARDIAGGGAGRLAPEEP